MPFFHSSRKRSGDIGLADEMLASVRLISVRIGFLLPGLLRGLLCEPGKRKTQYKRHEHGSSHGGLRSAGIYIFTFGATESVQQQPPSVCKATPTKEGSEIYKLDTNSLREVLNNLLGRATSLLNQYGFLYFLNRRLPQFRLREVEDHA
jgi:hypothetical protein